MPLSIHDRIMLMREQIAVMRQWQKQPVSSLFNAQYEQSIQFYQGEIERLLREYNNRPEYDLIEAGPE